MTGRPVIRDLNICGGAACIAGTRIPVAMIQSARERDMSWDAIRERWSALERSGLSDAQLEEACTFPRPSFEDGRVRLDADGWVEIADDAGDFIALRQKDIPSLSVALNRAFDAAVAWQVAVVDWERSHR